MNYISDSMAIDKISSEDAMNGMRGDIVGAVKLLWVILAKDVVQKIGSGGDEDALIGSSVKELASLILSSNICLCSLPFIRNQSGEGEGAGAAVLDLMKDILREENYPTTEGVGLGVLSLELLFSNSYNHSNKAHVSSTYDSKYCQLLQCVRTIVASELAYCILSALHSALTSRVIQVFPETISNCLDIDFICQLI